MGTWVLVDSPGQSSVYDCDVGKGGGSAADGGGDGGDAGGGTAARIGSRSFLISVFAKGGGQWQKMEAAIEALKEAGLQPTVVMQHAHQCIRGGRAVTACGEGDRSSAGGGAAASRAPPSYQRVREGRGMAAGGDGDGGDAEGGAAVHRHHVQLPHQKVRKRDGQLQKAEQTMELRVEGH